MALEARPAAFTRIDASRVWHPRRVQELWEYRELLWFLAIRDVSVRYKQTALGVAWAVIQPLFMVITFSVFFGKLGKLPSDGHPYPLFVLVAILPWQLFATAVTQSSQSLVHEHGLITKVYFPRLLVPLAAVLSGLADFGVTLALVALGLLFYGVSFTWAICTIPLFTGLAILAALAVGLWLSTLNVQYRDVKYLVPFATQVWMLLTPIAYPSSLVPEPYRTAYAINPMAGVIEGFRWAFFSDRAPDWGVMTVSATVVAVSLIAALVYFWRMEHTFADVV